MTQKLPKDLLDLIEHVELTRSGWWDTALANVLLAATWLHGEPVHRDNVRELVLSAFSLEIPADRIGVCTGRLITQGRLKVYDGDRVGPSNDIAEQMDTRLKNAQNNEDTVRAAFLDKVGNCCAPHSPEQTWTLFLERYFLPLLDLLGVRILNLMGGSGSDDADVAALTDDFLAQFEATHRTEIRSAVGRFLAPEDVSVRQYVTQHLDAMLLVRASGLTTEAIAGISRFGKKRPTFRLFLDTNFLFSLLNLHENPSNESAQTLARVIQQAGKHLSIRMNITYPTMEETKRTLRAFQASLSGMRMSRSLAGAALEVGLSGIAMRFARVNSESGPISPQDYFRPYLEDLTPILRSKGIEVYNEQLEEYRLRQDVIDDLNEMVDLDKEPENEKQRKYNAALHDSILWHVVHDRRPAVFESPMEAVYWVVTNDYRLINFDRRRQRAMRSAASVCVHPAELVQMLRLWEPRSTDMEQALLSGLRLPFMFYEFDVGRENASMRILKALARFELVGDLEPEAIRDIVLSEAVRLKTSAARTEEEENEVIREALMSEYGEIIRERDVALVKAKEAEQALEKQKEGAANREIAMMQEREDVKKQIAQLQTELDSSRESNQSMSDRMQTLEDSLAQRYVLERGSSLRSRFLLVRLVGGLTFTAVIAGLALAWSAFTATQTWNVVVSMAVVWIIGLIVISTSYIKEEDIRNWDPVKRIIALRQRAIWLIGVLSLGVVGNGIWQLILSPYFTA